MRAQALLLVDLDDVYYIIVDNTLTFIDDHPEIVRGLLLGTTRLASVDTVQRLVDEATGAIVERTLSTVGRIVAERAIGRVLNLRTLSEPTNAAGTGSGRGHRRSLSARSLVPLPHPPTPLRRPPLPRSLASHLRSIDPSG